MSFPLYKEFPYIEPSAVFAPHAEKFGAIFLDSALKHETLGRYSYIALDPFKIMESKNGKLTNKQDSANPFLSLSKIIKKYYLPAHPELPPFQGGLAGFFSYELSQHLENIPLANTDDMNFPDMMMGVYDCVAAFDHVEKKAYLFSSGFPEQTPVLQMARAQQRLDWFENQLTTTIKTTSGEYTPLKRSAIPSYFSRDDYTKAVQKCIDYILAGDIFEVNLSQRFTADLPENYSAIKLYERLRNLNPASFGAFINFTPTKIISASPERFLFSKNGHVETRPIKGTRPRSSNLNEDKKHAEELLTSAKDRAENIMIVDLMRNDLSRVCEPHSVVVPQLCGLESFATVHHLVSVVQGKLQKDLTAIDLLQAAFPGGSITGAPKIRAMEIIAELEPTQRGPYCGSIGYINWAGDMDTSITIRTILINGNKISYQVGGAIVADSNPAEEYEETLTKASALLMALTDG